MTVIFNNSGEPDWAETSSVLRSADIVYLIPFVDPIWAGPHDFGMGEEFAFACFGCGRMIPHETATIDHIRPRASLKGTFGETRNGFSFEKHGAQYTIRKEGYFRVFPGPNQDSEKVYYKSINKEDIVYDYNGTNHRIRIQQLLENDLSNLQPMCASCNSHKGQGSISEKQFRPRNVDDNQLRLPV